MHARPSRGSERPSLPPWGRSPGSGTLTPPANELQNDLRTGVPAPRPGAERVWLLVPRARALCSLLPSLGLLTGVDSRADVQASDTSGTTVRLWVGEASGIQRGHVLGLRPQPVHARERGPCLSCPGRDTGPLCHLRVAGSLPLRRERDA